jgi:hypothetical protein
MNYDNATLEAMSHEELLNSAKHLRDRILDGYSFLITNYGDKIKSVKTGEFVSFDEFIEHGKFKAWTAEFVKNKLLQ